MPLGSSHFDLDKINLSTNGIRKIKTQFTVTPSNRFCYLAFEESSEETEGQVNSTN